MSNLDQILTPRINNLEGFSIIIPAFNEEGSIEETLRKVQSTLQGHQIEIIVIDDGSTDQTVNIVTKNFDSEKVRILSHKENMGYGASLKHGLKEALFNKIIITDADGTYPIESIPELISLLETSDMVVGSRNGSKVSDRLFRKIGRGIVRKFASFIVNKHIPDINSGLRIFYKAEALKFWHLYPDGFSFTTTITVAYHIKNFKVTYLPINYYKRSGHSSIKPLKDFVGFMYLLTRLAIYFKPLRVFTPVALVLFGLSWIVLLLGILVNGEILDATWAILIISSLQILSVGLLADMIIKRIYND